MSETFRRRLNRHMVQRGLWQYVDHPEPARYPEARERLLRKLSVFHQAELPDIYLTPFEAAELAGCTDGAVYNWIKRGRIKAHKHRPPHASRRLWGRYSAHAWISYREFSAFLWGREIAQHQCARDSQLGDEA